MAVYAEIAKDCISVIISLPQHYRLKWNVLNAAVLVVSFVIMMAT